jgi:hypothetical protein
MSYNETLNAKNSAAKEIHNKKHYKQILNSSNGL